MVLISSFAVFEAKRVHLCATQDLMARSEEFLFALYINLSMVNVSFDGMIAQFDERRFSPSHSDIINTRSGRDQVIVLTKIETRSARLPKLGSEFRSEGLSYI